MKRKTNVEKLRGKLARMGVHEAIHPEMPEEVAAAFLAELRFDPDTGAIAACRWSPSHRNEQPWIQAMLDGQRSVMVPSDGNETVK